MEYSDLLIEHHDKVVVIRLNRPKAMNALNDNMMNELGDALYKFDADPAVNVIILTGSDKVFAAGADIAAMANYSYADTYPGNYIGRNWEHILNVRKPVIGVVAGYALGGGCELAMMCDFVIAAEDAQFGQPEIKLGILPGIGGSQRLTRAVGKALAMDLILTGRTIGAAEAKAAGLVARIVPAAVLLQTALEAAHTIAGYNAPAVRLAKEAVNRAQESFLGEGILHERRLFQAAFATEGQKEGMHAFLAKRAPVFRHR
jgi:enoyl-CoA hydratase